MFTGLRRKRSRNIDDDPLSFTIASLQGATAVRAINETMIFVAVYFGWGFPAMALVSWFAARLALAFLCRFFDVNW